MKRRLRPCMVENEPATARPIDGFSGYFVDVDGSVYSKRRRVAFRLRPRMDAYGYPIVCLATDQGKSRWRKVHRLVAQAFLPPAPDLPFVEVRHLDGTRDNNAVSNLAWGTRKENANDRERHGTHLRGENHPKATLTNAQVREMRNQLSAGRSVKFVADQFGISVWKLYHIRAKRIWAHV